MRIGPYKLLQPIGEGGMGNATEGVSFSDDRLTYSGRELGEPGSMNGAAESTRFTEFGSLAPPFVGVACVTAVAPCVPRR
jgi:hypothetical protein